MYCLNDRGNILPFEAIAGENIASEPWKQDHSWGAESTRTAASAELGKRINFTIPALFADQREIAAR